MMWKGVTIGDRSLFYSYIITVWNERILNGGKVKDDKSFQTNYFRYYTKVVIFFFLKIKQKSEFL